MDRLSLLSLLLLGVCILFDVVDPAARAETNDPLIRQVVAEGGDESLLNADHHFSLFKAQFGKTYATQEEHDYRLSVFKANMRCARSHQLLDPSAEHGVTKFSDLT